MILVASDVTPTDRWLNVWCIWHTKVETLQEFRSGHRIGWIIQDFWETCVAFFNVPLGNKDAVAPNPLTKEESRRVYNCDDEHLSGSTKRWIFKSMWNIQSSQHRIFKIRPRVLHTGLLLWRHFHALKCDAERNKLWLVVWHVSQTASWAGLGQWKLPWIPDLEPSVWRSGYVRLWFWWSYGFVHACAMLLYLLQSV